MDYKNYIDLGFERTDMNDPIEFNQTGYSGFCLGKTLNERISVNVCAGELDRPKLYVKKGDSETFHIITITPEVVQDLFN